MWMLQGEGETTEGHVERRKKSKNRIEREGLKYKGEKAKEKQKKKPVKPLTVRAWLQLSTCASLAISKPRLIRQALNSSAPRVPEWSWGVGGQCQARRRGHRPCSNTYRGVSGGEVREWWWKGAGQVRWCWWGRSRSGWGEGVVHHARWGQKEVRG